MPGLLNDVSIVTAMTVAMQIVGFVTIIALGFWGFRDMRRGQAELKRLDIVLGSLIYQEDEKIRALVNNRIDELLAQLSR